MLLEDFLGLAEVGVVQEAEPGKWSVTNFSKRQAAVPVEERVRKSRSSKEPVTDRNRSGNEDVTKRYKSCNEAGGASSSSTSESDSRSYSAEEGGQGEEPPRTPVEAMVHPDARVYTVVTGGRIPGLSQYTHVIEAVCFLRKKLSMDDRALAENLKPFWLVWSSRKRQDGRSYDPGNITWLTEWALNGTSPPEYPSQGASKQDQAEVIRCVARGRK